MRGAETHELLGPAEAQHRQQSTAPTDKTTSRSTEDALRKLAPLAALKFKSGEPRAHTYRDWVQVAGMQLEATTTQVATYWEEVLQDVSIT